MTIYGRFTTTFYCHDYFKEYAANYNHRYIKNNVFFYYIFADIVLQFRYVFEYSSGTYATHLN